MIFLCRSCRKKWSFGQGRRWLIGPERIDVAGADHGDVDQTGRGSRRVVRALSAATLRSRFDDAISVPSPLRSRGPLHGNHEKRPLLEFSIGDHPVIFKQQVHIVDII
ncbi:hypothetical protein [Sphingobium mellinum]|uniref:hypothetical protein n=1 Tax=Sphingobium mellinum TaxID=1387166 RepID=UPI0030ED5559